MCIINPMANRSNYRLLLGGYGRSLTHTGADWKRKAGKKGFLGNDMDRILNDNWFKKKAKDITGRGNGMCKDIRSLNESVCHGNLYFSKIGT